MTEPKVTTISAHDWIESRYKRFAREFRSSRPKPDPHRMGLMTEREWKRLEAARVKLGLNGYERNST